MLSVEQFNLSFGDTIVLQDINLAFSARQITAIIGASGCGKTTLLRSLNGSVFDANAYGESQISLRSSGRIFLDNTLVEAYQDSRRRIALIKQKPTVFPMSIMDNMLFGLRYYGELSQTEQYKKAIHCLQQAALYDEVAHILDAPASSLSGGQQQRLCIARSLTVDPEVILLDEPCSALDMKNSLAIESTLVEFANTKTIVLVTHNLQQAKRIADYVVYMDGGCIIEQGPVEQVLNNPTEEATKSYISYSS